MDFSWLPEPECHPLWPAIHAMLQPAADYGGIDVCDDGDWVWIAHDGGTVFAAAVTRLVPGDEAELRLAGGTRLADWIGLLDGIASSWARTSGAHRLTMRGRRGWRRYAGRFGWRVIGADQAGRTMYEKDL